MITEQARDKVRNSSLFCDLFLLNYTLLLLQKCSRKKIHCLEWVTCLSLSLSQKEEEKEQKFFSYIKNKKIFNYNFYYHLRQDLVLFKWAFSIYHGHLFSNLCRVTLLKLLYTEKNKFWVHCLLMLQCLAKRKRQLNEREKNTGIRVAVKKEIPLSWEA